MKKWSMTRGRLGWHRLYSKRAAHNLERAADRVTNLCERVIFTVTGELEELDADQELALLDLPPLPPHEPPAEAL